VDVDACIAWDPRGHESERLVTQGERRVQAEVRGEPSRRGPRRRKEADVLLDPLVSPLPAVSIRDFVGEGGSQPDGVAHRASQDIEGPGDAGRAGVMVEDRRDPASRRVHGGHKTACSDGRGIERLVEPPPQLLEDLREGARGEPRDGHAASERAVRMRVSIDEPGNGQLARGIDLLAARPASGAGQFSDIGDPIPVDRDRRAGHPVGAIPDDGVLYDSRHSGLRHSPPILPTCRERRRMGGGYALSGGPTIGRVRYSERESCSRGMCFRGMPAEVRRALPPSHRAVSQPSCPGWRSCVLAACSLFGSQ